MRATALTFFLLALGCSAKHEAPADLVSADDASPVSPPPSSSPDAGTGADAVAADAPAEAAPPNTACAPTDPRATPVVLSVLPDEGETPFVQLLSSATTQIKVFGYEMGYGGVLDTLTAKAKA